MTAKEKIAEILAACRASDVGNAIITAACPDCGGSINSTMTHCCRCGYQINRDIDTGDHSDVT